ncbi:MAG: hypothetical protein ABEJ02_04675 [Candidatus Paceibacteria bacterium]
MDLSMSYPFQGERKDSLLRIVPHMLGSELTVGHTLAGLLELLLRTMQIGIRLAVLTGSSSLGVELTGSRLRANPLELLLGDSVLIPEFLVAFGGALIRIAHGYLLSKLE